MKCIICSQYFKLSAYHQGYECPDCVSIVLDEIDSEMKVELDLLRYPSGKTAAKIYDDLNDEDTGDSI
jgi:hypothetical protein